MRCHRKKIFSQLLTRPTTIEKPFWRQLLAECEDPLQDDQLRETARWAREKIMMRTGGQ